MYLLLSLLLHLLRTIFIFEHFIAMWSNWFSYLQLMTPRFARLMQKGRSSDNHSLHTSQQKISPFSFITTILWGPITRLSLPLLSHPTLVFRSPVVFLNSRLQGEIEIVFLILISVVCCWHFPLCYNVISWRNVWLRTWSTLASSSLIVFPLDEGLRL